MSNSPVIAFGQQPCGFFPRRFLFAKFQTARRLRNELGGRVVFFYHYSDHDPRETKTILRHRKTDEALPVNFVIENKIQRKFSPLHLKRIAKGWHERTAGQIPPFVPECWAMAFRECDASANVADFCLEMYRRMGLLEGVEIVRSSDPAVRRSACDIKDFFVDVPYEGETVRARYANGEFKLHEGGDAFITVPATSFTKEQISPTRDSRLAWMQSILHCTHYIAGAGEQDYLRKEDAPDITFVSRDTIDRSDESYTDIPAF
jgi:hypothetical protein